jgi:DNA-binding NarL/FixJ family response regulator
MKGFLETCLAAGMDGYISKPVHAARLFQVIDSVLSKGSDEEAVKPTSDAGDRPFDESTILARMQGSQELLAGLIEAFLGECPGLMTQVCEAVLLRDAARLAEATHA